MMTMEDISLSGKRVLIREDLNVPLKDGEITDDTRIRSAIPTLRQALQAGAHVMVLSHLGRPTEGGFDESSSLAPIADRLSKLLGQDVPIIKDWLDGVEVDAGEAVLCENVRFEIGEKANDDTLARKMAALCDVYVNDAFATAHRAQASTHGVAKYAPVSCAGPLLAAEIEALGKALDDPARPLIAIVGGAKVSTKLQVLESLIDKVEQLIVGGGIANTFLRAAGYPIGRSLYEENLVPVAKGLLDKARARGAEISIPKDVVCAEEFSEDAHATIKMVDAVSDNDMILDIGPETTDAYVDLLKKAGTIVWNGPVGVFEFNAFQAGTKEITNAVAESNAFSIAGGGDTLAAIAKFGITDHLSYISTGGGAFLEFLEGKRLPAVTILEERERANPGDTHACEGY